MERIIAFRVSDDQPWIQLKAQYGASSWRQLMRCLLMDLEAQRQANHQLADFVAYHLHTGTGGESHE